MESQYTVMQGILTTLSKTPINTHLYKMLCLGTHVNSVLCILLDNKSFVTYWFVYCFAFAYVSVIINLLYQ